MSICLGQEMPKKVVLRTWPNQEANETGLVLLSFSLGLSFQDLGWSVQMEEEEGEGREKEEEKLPARMWVPDHLGTFCPSSIIFKDREQHHSQGHLGGSVS